MNWTNIAIDILLFFFVIVSVLMCLVVLMQKSKQEGLGAAFGGGAMQEFIGTGTSAFLVKTTCILAALFFILSIALAWLNSHQASLAGKPKVSILDQELMKPGTPASTNAAPVSAVTPATSVSTNAAPSAPVKPAK